MDKAYYVYMLASRRNGTLYTGVTSDLTRRVWEHKEGFVSGFTKEHAVKTLVRYEEHDNPEAAITREKQIKKWNRIWKMQLIEAANPYWNDLYSDIAS